MPLNPTVIISQGQGHNPSRRALEETIAADVLNQTDVDVIVVPNLYDLLPNGPSLTALRQVPGDLIVLSWLYPRGTHWVLDRHGVRGQAVRSSLAQKAEPAADENSISEAEHDGKERVLQQREVPARKICCLDFRWHSTAEPFVAEVTRIVREAGHRELAAGAGARQAVRIDEPASRRWYPVIDYSRCTNCMECIDFCLFGVYGVDFADTILVEQPDNCRKGCPACSRVCPEHAIVFPQHKTPTIAGASGNAGGLKIDLSKLFGAPEETANPWDVAVRERDEHVEVSGRATVASPARNPPPQDGGRGKAKDELDRLLDALDAAEL